MQVTHDDFSDDAEQHQWFKDKTKEFEDAQHPVRQHSNWRLEERFYIHNRGRSISTKTSVEENLKRSASDLAGTSSIMGMPPEKKKDTKSPEQLHQMGLNRATALMSRLSKCISTCETNMPAWKRKLQMSQFIKIRESLQSCRSIKDTLLDELEDIRVLPTDPSLHDEIITKVNHMHSVLLDHIGALTEVMQKYKVEGKKTIKKDHDEIDLCILAKKLVGACFFEYGEVS